MKNCEYDHHSAIYHLLLDKLKKHPKTLMNKLPNTEGVPDLPMATTTRRRSSITTGVGKLGERWGGKRVVRFPWRMNDIDHFKINLSQVNCRKLHSWVESIKTCYAYIQLQEHIKRYKLRFTSWPRLLWFRNKVAMNIILHVLMGTFDILFRCTRISD